MITLDFKSVKAQFFDRKTVIDKVDKAKRKVLSRAGAFVRTRAKSSIRKRKGVSLPGGPPHSHTGLLKKFLFFSYDDRRDSVVIGPTKLNATASPTALPALEYGGISSTLETDFSTGRRRRRRRRITIQARPFMAPALAAEQPKIDRMWQDSVR